MDLQYHHLLLMVVYDWNKSNLTIMYCYSSLNADSFLTLLSVVIPSITVFILYLALPVSHYKILFFFLSMLSSPPFLYAPPPPIHMAHTTAVRATLVIAKDAQL